MRTPAKISLIALAAMGATLVSAQSVRVQVDGSPVNFSGTTPRVVGQRVLVPLRGVFEEMGAYVNWDGATQTVKATQGDKDVQLKIGERRAMVDGSLVNLDVPAQLVGGRTMVPLRFISESLGAAVDWNEGERLVMITTDGATSVITKDTSKREETEKYPSRLLVENTVLPVSLDETLRSNEARTGDTFTATLRSNENDDYAGLPTGTKVIGRVVSAKAQKGSEPGILELEFNKMRLPDGRTVNIDGSLISLENKNVKRNSEGVLESTGNKKDDRLVFAGYGAGAGLIVGLLTKKPLEGAILGGLIGFIVGATNKDKEKPSNVVLEPGTRFGVRIDRDVTIQ